MRRFVHVVLACVGLAVLLGCITMHPLGMSDAEWNALTPEQKLAAREKQAELDSQKKREKERQEAAEHAAVADRYRSARRGDIVSVSISGGTMEIHGKRREYEPIAFDLVKGESKKIEIIRRGKQYEKDTAVVRLSDDGRTFYFDDEQRDRIVLVDEGWARGKTYRITKHKNHNTDPRDIEIHIRYRHVDNGRDKVIIIR